MGTCGLTRVPSAYFVATSISVLYVLLVSGTDVAALTAVVPQHMISPQRMSANCEELIVQVEGNREDLGIQEYSLSQTTLEQVRTTSCLRELPVVCGHVPL